MNDNIHTTEIVHLNSWNQLLAQHQEQQLSTLLSHAPPVEISDFLLKQSPATALKILTPLPQPLQGSVFAELDGSYQLSLYQLASKKNFAAIFSHMPSDDRADFYQRLGDKEQARLFPYLTKRIREDVIALSAYPAKTAGGIMSTDFATVLEDMTVKQATKKLREDSPSKKMIYYLYVVDKSMRMIGFVSLKDLIMAAPQDQVVTILHENFIYATVDEDQEKVAERIEKYDLIAIPILNEEKQLVGIVSYDDAMDVLRVEQTEDMEKFMGIVSKETDTDYLDASSFQHFQKRIAWVVGLFIAGSLSSLVIHKHEAILGRITVLALYLPMIADTGGNAGSQAASVVIRALSLGQVTLGHWLSIILKEAKIALLLAFSLFFLAFAKVMILSGHTHVGCHSVYRLAFAIGLALSLQVVTATVIGAALPLIANYFNGDPAVAASPAITTIVDITGMSIYFAIALALVA
ncbi:MAG: magnesium transporter [Bacteroidota bacterium]